MVEGYELRKFLFKKLLKKISALYCPEIKVCYGVSDIIVLDDDYAYPTYARYTVL
ncbi:hypothetical protein SALSENF004_01570 [Salmonella enterica subsp. enterica serovar Senftenberg]